METLHLSRLVTNVSNPLYAGIDTDGQTIYMPVAEYHSGDVCGAVPNCTLPGTSYMYRVSATDLQVGRFNVHQGHLVT